MAGFNHFDEIAEKLIVLCEALPMEIAQDVVDYAQALVPVDTGYLQSSIHTAPGTDSMSAQVVVDASYGVYVEFGTYKMAAQPYFNPAVEQANADVPTRLAELMEELA